MQLDVPEKSAVCIFADKEEIGSEGVSGMQSEAFEHFMKTLCGMQSVEDVYKRQCRCRPGCGART